MNNLDFGMFKQTMVRVHLLHSHLPVPALGTVKDRQSRA